MVEGDTLKWHNHTHHFACRWEHTDILRTGWWEEYLDLQRAKCQM